MPHPRKVIRTVPKFFRLPEDLVARMELCLFSELEGRIPVNRQQEFVTRALRTALDREFPQEVGGQT